ncbi:3-deoxy-D-manno-octulosonic acid transferase [Candidatus Scalindua japonica]|nr:3-deoxy-D-manno-octulosonic acid transferase [Candidatus Scalindua japonica]
MVTSKRYRTGLNQRFGITTDRTGNKPGIWVHGASVGEVITAKSIVKRIDEEFPECEIFISATTNTGFSVAEKTFSDKNVFFLPADLSWITKKVILKKKPNFILLVELEIWPNFLISAYKKKIPVIIVNGRISDRSLKAYRALSYISKDFRKSLTNEMNTFCARTELDAQRFRDLGIADKQIFVTGTMKYDNIPTRIDEGVSKELKGLFHINDDDLVLVGGSTHDGEEEVLVRIYAKLNETYPNLKLILVPRHIERARDVARLIEKMGFVSVRKTEAERSHYEWQKTKKTIILIDTVGDLGKIYSLSNYVFVGKSLIPSGGQNMMEPAGLGKPVVFGPHTFNFKEETELLLKNDAAKVAKTEVELFETIETFIRDPETAKEMGLKAQKIINEKRGATNRNIEIIRNIIMN